MKWKTWLQAASPACLPINSVHPPTTTTTSPSMNHPYASMPSTMTPQQHTPPRPSKISLLFVSEIIGCVIGLILREFGVLAVGKNVLIDGFNVFDDEWNSAALSPITSDTNDTTGATHNTASNFANLGATVGINNDIAFDLTAVLPASTAAPVATTIRIENANVIWDRIGFDWNVNDIFEYYFDGIGNAFNNASSGMCIFVFFEKILLYSCNVSMSMLDVNFCQGFTVGVYLLR